MSTAIELLRLSHLVVPWIVVARRLRKEHRSFWDGPSPELGATPSTIAAPVAESPPARRPPKNKKKKKGQRAPDPPAQAAPASAEAPAPTKREHHTHVCPSCRAPVPLADSPFACPYCTAAIVPPPEVAAAYHRIVWAKRALQLAERAWKRAVLWNGPLWVILFALVIIVWSGSYTYLVIAASEQRGKLPFTKLDRILLMASAPSGLFGWWTGVMLAVHKDGLGRIVGPMPRASFDALPAMSIACSHCGADARFAEGRFTTLCAYCGAEEARPALAQRAKAQAETVGKAAEFSMIDAYRAIVKRREALLMYIDIMALCAVVFVVIEMLKWIPMVAKVFAFFE